MPRSMDVRVGHFTPMAPSCKDRARIYDWVVAVKTGGSRSALVPGTYKPSTATAGVLAGVTRTSFTGDRTITTAGTIIENQDITGWIRVRAANVTIRNCKFLGTQTTPTGDTALIDCNNNAVTGCVIEDCTFEPVTPHYYLYGINGHHFTARRNIFRWLVDGLQPYNTTTPGGDLQVSITANLFEEFYWTNVPAGVHSDLQTHNDAVQIQDGRGIAVVGNMFDMHYSQTKSTLPTPKDASSPGTDGLDRPRGSLTAVMFSPNFATPYIGPCTITDNWMYAGSIPVNAGSPAGFNLGVIQRNKFDRNQGSQGPGGDFTRTIIHDKTATLDAGVGTADANVYEDNGHEVYVDPNW